MQFFPVDTSAMNQTAGGQVQDYSQKDSDQASAFGGMYQSFIEEDRLDYSGRPAGFAAYGPESGTISYEDSARFAAALREREVAEVCVDKFERLSASGSPVTIGSTFKTLSGSGRLTEGLNDDERAAFKAALGRLGLSKSEQEELLALSDEGENKALLERIAAAVKNLDSALDLSPAELNALLKGLDLSKGSRQGLLAAFASENISLNGSQFDSIMQAAQSEYAARDIAFQHARNQMQEAMADVLKTRKNAELASQINDMRGNRRSEQSEALMQATLREKTGADNVKQDGVAEQAANGGKHDPRAARQNAGDADEGFEDRESGKSRAQRILNTNAERSENTASSTGSGKADPDAAAQLLSRIDVAAAPASAQPQPSAPTQAPNVNTQAATYREEIFSQVENGILQNMHNGTQRLTLHLKPAELGQLTVVLSMNNGELKATIRAENQDAASVLREQMAELRQTLEAQGLKVKELDVQTGLSDNALAGQWDGHQEHNLMRDASERDRVIRLARIRRDTAGQGPEAALESPAAAMNNNGLHIVA